MQRVGVSRLSGSREELALVDKNIMKSLKFALSTEESRKTDKGEIDGSLLRGVNKSKNQSMWAFDADDIEDGTEESLHSDNLMKILNDKLEAAFLKDSKTISEVALPPFR